MNHQDSSKVHIANNETLSLTIMRRKNKDSVRMIGIDLGMVLREIAEWANKFVPSESGSILLDDPIRKLDETLDGRLYFAACFGRSAESLVGTHISDSKGIAGETYKGGKPYISKDVASDDKFHGEIDKKTSYRTQSIICAPIKIKDSIIGVIELINRQHRTNFDANDLILLEIFAGYTALLMENSLAAREFEEMSKRDNLTGLYNDRFFMMRLEAEAGRASAQREDTSVIFFDLDRFKEINDTHGHLAGSRVLREIGALVAELFADTNAVCARYGGDEYAVIMPGTSGDEAMMYAEAVRSRIEGFTFLAEPGPRGEPAYNIKGIITASVGVASQSTSVPKELSVPQDMGEALLRAADQAMYKAKNSGKNKVEMWKG